MRSATVTALATLSLMGTAGLWAQQTVPGEPLDPVTCGPSYVETMEHAIIRNRLAPSPPNEKQRQPGEQGVWMVPKREATSFPHSGEHNAVNKWGDTRMGIRFPRLVDVQGAYFAGQSAPAVWTPAIRARGYRYGALVQETEWFTAIGAQPQWFAMNLDDVDRLEIIAQPVLGGGGWYGMDDLTYTPANDRGSQAQRVVIDFEDLPYDFRLTGSSYRGLTWEIGSGDFEASRGVHSPMVPPGMEKQVAEHEPAQVSGSRATPPTLLTKFQGVLRGDAGSWSYPPDSIGAIGPNHYVETVNRNFAVYDRASGNELVNILLGSFLPGSNGDPRVLFDQHSQRWFVIVCDFSATASIYLAVSRTADPMGSWFKTSFVTAQGSDAGKWPDYPTLGVDAHGLYTAAYMVGSGSKMTIFALDKAPLIADPPYLGTITAFRNLPWEGAIQPAHTYGTAPGEYLVSWYSSTALRVRRINPPLTAPTLTEVGTVTVPYFSDPPDAPALGSTVPLDTVDKRLMMAVYRDGSLWTAHTINVSGRAGCRWYQLDPATPALIQQGTVADSSLYYFFPSIMVNRFGDVVMGFTGSNASQYAGCYYTGRKAGDPAGEMAPPTQYKPGTGPQNNIDGYGRNRWGDYSYTVLDPLAQIDFWTIQEYGHAENIWGTYVGVLRVPFTDCNSNGIPDQCDLSCGPAGSACDIPGCGQSQDCNDNDVPDECEGAVPGDTNCDGVVSFDDINPFVVALNGQAAYQAAYPNCRWLNADLSGDCGVTFSDINPFVELLAGK